MDRLADHAPGPPQRGHQDQWGQLAEVLARARDALVEPLVAEAVLGQVAGVRHGHGAVGHLPAVEALAQRLPHRVLDRGEERQGHRAQLRLDPEPHPGPGGGRLDAEPDRGQERVGRLVQPLHGRAAAERPLDADRGRLAEADRQAEVGGQGRPDDLLLDLTVERDVHLLAEVVLAQVDQRVLLGQLGEGRVQGAPVGGTAGDDHRLQGRRVEVAPGAGGPGDADLVADPDLAEAPELADLPGGDGRAPDGRRAVLEHADRGDLALAVAAQPQPVPHPDGAREQADVGDLLPGRAALDLEHGARDRAGGVALGRGQQLADAGGGRRPSRPRRRRPAAGRRGRRPGRPAGR